MAHNHGETARVLVVDDDPHIRESLRLILEDEGYSVDTAADGKTGVEAAINAQPPYPVIMTDNQMPGTSAKNSGIVDMVDAVIAAGLPSSVIGMTANVQMLTPEQRERFKELGDRFALMQKPFDLDKLLAALASLAALGVAHIAHDDLRGHPEAR